jgi:tripartite-type tricarboxylate transporter receptor subunit TctC
VLKDARRSNQEETEMAIWTPSRRRLLQAGAAGLAAPAVLRVSPARASWPQDKPVKIVVPFAPGGPTDIMARIVGAHLSDKLKGAFVIENKAGAGGNIGMGEVARAEPDGYTLLITSSSLVVNPSLAEKIPYDPAKDFEPISELGASPNVFVVHNDLPVKTMAELVALAKKDPNKLNYASPGIGTTPHLAAELLKVRAGIQMAHVSHNGAGPAVQAVLAGTTQVGCIALPPAHPHIQGGKMRALAVTSAARWYDMTSVPTMVESGYKDFVADTLQAFLAPAKTPKGVVDLLVGTTEEILKQPDVAEKLRKAGFDGLNKGVKGLRSRIEKEVPMWRAVVSDAGIKVR